ncbi:CHAT domain-containing protein [Micromonospora sp. NPDC005220]|uniref:CHAT domain-containing protein n=1 Tax=Micromonospora sp. NPDC005220 TaxID=3155589 RepID=UPI0033A99DC5
MAPDDVLPAALAEVLCRHCLGYGQPSDAETARRILLSLQTQGNDVDILTAAVGGVYAAYRPDADLTTALAREAVASARALLRARILPAEVLLAAVSLALLVERRTSDRPGPDLVAVAISAQRIDQDRLGRWAAERAISRRAELTPSQEAAARLTLALFTQDRADVLAAYAITDRLPPDDPRARQAEQLRPTLHPDANRTMSIVGEAVRAGDRQSAAAALANEFADVHRDTGDTLIGGLQAAVAAMSGPDVDVDGARRGLTIALAELRGRQRYGQVPPVARAGIDVVADLLKTDATPASVNVLAELMEALADAGLSEVALGAQDGDLPAVTQARLAAAAQTHPVWPDLPSCIRGLGGRHVLIMRRQRMFAARHGAVLSFFIEPPDAGAVKSTILNARHTALLNAVARGEPVAMSAVTAADVDELVNALLPTALLDRLASDGLESVLIVPDGALWSVPWQAASMFRDTVVSMAPSLSVYARLPAFDGVVRSVTALVEPHMTEADVVRDALNAAAHSGQIEVRDQLGIELTTPSDLLLVFAHGGGKGLNFRTGHGIGSLSALQLAKAVRGRAALVASCRSLDAPPVSFPINLPAAMMISGVSAVVGGLWPLPTISTAAVVAEVVTALAAGERLATAVAKARTAAPDGLQHRWGLAMHGRV